jgi:hypothetical protein
MAKHFNIFDLYETHTGKVPVNESETISMKPGEVIKRRLENATKYDKKFSSLRRAASESKRSKINEITKHDLSEQLDTESGGLSPKEITHSLSVSQVRLTKNEIATLQSKVLVPKKRRSRYELSEAIIEDWKRVMNLRSKVIKEG